MKEISQETARELLEACQECAEWLDLVQQNYPDMAGLIRGLKHAKAAITKAEAEAEQSPPLTAAQHNAFPRGRWSSSIILAALLFVSASPCLATPAAHDVTVTPWVMPVTWDQWYLIAWDNPNKNAMFEITAQVEIAPDLWITVGVFTVGYDANVDGFYLFLPKYWDKNRAIIAPVKHLGQEVVVKYPQ